MYWRRHIMSAIATDEGQQTETFIKKLKLYTTCLGRQWINQMHDNTPAAARMSFSKKLQWSKINPIFQGSGETTQLKLLQLKRLQTISQKPVCEDWLASQKGFDSIDSDFIHQLFCSKNPSHISGRSLVIKALLKDTLIPQSLWAWLQQTWLQQLV